MKEHIYLIYDKTNMKSVSEIRTSNVLEAYRNYKVFCKNQIQQDTRFIPRTYDDYKLFYVGCFNPDFTDNDSKPYFIFDNMIEIDESTVRNFLNENKISNNAFVIHDFTDKKMEEIK